MGKIDLGKIAFLYYGDWTRARSYETLSGVHYNGNLYISVKDSTGVEPGTDDSVWKLAAKKGQSMYDLAVKYLDYKGTEAQYILDFQAAVDNAVRAAAAIQQAIDEANYNNSRAVQDHTRAEADHTRAEGDHVRADDDHVTSDQSSNSALRAGSTASAAAAAAAEAAQAANIAAMRAHYGVDGETLTIASLTIIES